MGRIIISAGHHRRDPGAIYFGTTEAREMILTRDLMVRDLKARGVAFLSVPDHLTLRQTIDWINRNALPGDVALEIHGNAFNGSVRGTEIFYVYGNSQRRKDGELLINSLRSEVSGLPNRGSKPDSRSQHSSGLGFCRQVAIPSLLMELCFIDNRQDLDLLQKQRDKFARGLAKGLIAWSGQRVKSQTPASVAPKYPIINIRIQGNDYPEKGILVNGNSFIPSNLAEMLNIDVAPDLDVRQITYGGIVYIKAVDLQRHNVAVSWDNPSRSVVLNLRPQTSLEDADQIMGMGNATTEQLTSFLENYNNKATDDFPNIAQIYIEEAEKEGVNYDVAFSQMCLATNYLRFGGWIKADQNNFCGLGDAKGSATGAVFPDIRTGVKAHIEHLKAYASTDMIKQQPIVDPRFDYVPRGVAPSVHDLSRRWSSDPNYGEKIMTILKRIYEVF